MGTGVAKKDDGEACRWLGLTEDDKSNFEKSIYEKQVKTEVESGRRNKQVGEEDAESDDSVMERAWRMS